MYKIHFYNENSQGQISIKLPFSLRGVPVGEHDKALEVSNSVYF